MLMISNMLHINLRRIYSFTSACRWCWKTLFARNDIDCGNHHQIWLKIQFNEQKDHVHNAFFLTSKTIKALEVDFLKKKQTPKNKSGCASVFYHVISPRICDVLLPILCKKTSVRPYESYLNMYIICSIIWKQTVVSQSSASQRRL